MKKKEKQLRQERHAKEARETAVSRVIRGEATQRGAARDLGVSQSTISKWVAARRKQSKADAERAWHEAAKRKREAAKTAKRASRAPTTTKDLIREAKKATEHYRVFVVQHNAHGGRISAEFADVQKAVDYYVQLEGEATLSSKRVK